MSHPVNLFDGDMMFQDFTKYIAVNLDRLETLGCMPVAVALREDLWPVLANWHGYPVVRLAANSETLWGVLA